jgi:hypothetical protein
MAFCNASTWLHSPLGASLYTTSREGALVWRLRPDRPVSDWSWPTAAASWARCRHQHQCNRSGVLARRQGDYNRGTGKAGGRSPHASFLSPVFYSQNRWVLWCSGQCPLTKPHVLSKQPQTSPYASHHPTCALFCSLCLRRCSLSSQGGHCHPGLNRICT